MSGGWQVVDTLHKKKEKLKQKHADNAVESAIREKKRAEEQQEKEAELKRLGLGFTITDVSTSFNKPQVKKGKGKSKQINTIYDLHIPNDEVKKKKKNKDDKPKKNKEPKEPKERKEKSGLADACANLDVDNLKSSLKKIDLELAELLESSFPKIQGFTGHNEGHLYRRIHSPFRTFQENNEEAFTVIREWIGDRPISGDFVIFLVDLLNDSSVQGAGVRILLSILARYHPQKIVGESQYIMDHLPFRTVSWLFLQTMYADPDLALLLWVRHVLPQYINGQKENPEAVLYLSCLFTYIRKKGHRVHVPMPEEELAAELGQFLIARATFSEENFTLIKDHYYELLDTSFIAPKNPTKLFEELLELTTNRDSKVSNAAYDALIYNLKVNTELFNVWKEIYSQHVAESNNFLVHIRRNYEQIQTSSLPLIVQEAHTYTSDVSSDDRSSEDGEEEEKERKRKPIREIGASMEINGKTVRHSASSSSSSSSRKPRPTPISIRELQLLLTRIEEVNKELADVKKPKGKKKDESEIKVKKVNKDTLNISNATCQELRNTITASKSGRENERSVLGTCVKGVIGLAGLIGVIGFALQYVDQEEVQRFINSKL